MPDAPFVNNSKNPLSPRIVMSERQEKWTCCVRGTEIWLRGCVPSDICGGQAMTPREGNGACRCPGLSQGFSERSMVLRRATGSVLAAGPAFSNRAPREFLFCMLSAECSIFILALQPLGDGSSAAPRGCRGTPSRRGVYDCVRLWDAMRSP